MLQTDNENIAFLCIKQTKTLSLHHTMAVFIFTLFIKIPVSKGNKLTEILT